MVLTREATSNNIIATIMHHDKVTQYECQLSSCANPNCRCGEMELTLTPIQEQHKDMASCSPQVVMLDVFDHRLSSRHTDTELSNFAQNMLSQLQEEDYDLLQHEHLLQKRYYTEHTELHAIDAAFPIQEIEETGLIIAYNDVLPFAKAFIITFDKCEYVVLDRYCVRSTCNCTDIVLSYFSLDTPIAPEYELGTYDLDYKKRVWKDAKASGYFHTAVECQRFRKVLEATYPSIYKEFKQRHRALKILYANYAKKHGLVQKPTVKVKVGRNAPCPCGSGKKFKKCCGVQGMS